MKKLNDIKEQLQSHIAAGSIYSRKPHGEEKEVKLWNRNKNKWIKERKLLEKRVQFLEVPNAEKSLLGMYESLTHKISVIDQRWEGVKNNYLVEGLRRDQEDKRKAHHHAQYNYKTLLKQLEEVNYLLD